MTGTAVHPKNVTITPGERGAVCEAWIKSASGAVVGMYRYRKRRWEYRNGFGQVWTRCDRPGSTLPADVIQRLETN